MHLKECSFLPDLKEVKIKNKRGFLFHTKQACTIMSGSMYVLFCSIKKGTKNFGTDRKKILVSDPFWKQFMDYIFRNADERTYIITAENFSTRV